MNDLLFKKNILFLLFVKIKVIGFLKLVQILETLLQHVNFILQLPFLLHNNLLEILVFVFIDLLAAPGLKEDKKLIKGLKERGDSIYSI
jgi:hypothetical protein